MGSIWNHTIDDSANEPRKKRFTSCCHRINGVIAYGIVNVAFNLAYLTKFLQNNLFQALQRNSVVIMDNARFHHSAIVVEAFRVRRAELKFLPPYSPQLNPIEEVFAMIKNRYRDVRPRPTSPEQMKREVMTIVENLANTSFQNFYSHSKQYLTLANRLMQFL